MFFSTFKSFEPNSPDNVRLSLLNNGNFVVTWHLGPYSGSSRSGDSDGIYCQIFSPVGIAISEVIKVNTTDTKNEWNPVVSSTGNGGFIICWQSGLWDINKANIFGQVYDSNGLKINNEFLINLDTLGLQCDPNITDFKVGQKIITWLSRESIVAQIVNDNGELIGDEFIINIYSEDNDEYPVNIKLGNGSIAFAWTGGNENNNYLKIFDSDLNVVVNKHDFSDNSFIKGDVHLNSFNNNGFILYWQDYEDNILCRYLLNEPIIHELNNFQLIAPEMDATINTVNPTFTWRSSTKTKICHPIEIIYNIIFSQNIDFPETQTIEVCGDTSFTVNNLLEYQTYFWKVHAKNIAGDSLWSSNVNGFYIDPNATDVEIAETTVPDKFELYQNYPNPFNPTTKIKYTIPNVERFAESLNNSNKRIGNSLYNVTLKVYDVLGKEVAILVNKEQSAGNYEVEFNPSADGKRLSSGVYFYTIQAGANSITKKMLLLR